MAKRKSPKNYRRAKRAAANGGWGLVVSTLGELTFTDESFTMYYHADPVATTMNIPTGSFHSDGFAAGDLITIAGCTESKRDKNVHPARRRIPKRGNNGTYVITSVDDNSTITITDTNSISVGSNVTLNYLYDVWKDWTLEVNVCVE